MEAVSLMQYKPNIRCIGTKMLVKPDIPKERIERGIIIPLTTNSQLEEAEVILVADEVAPYIQPGEKVLYPMGIGVEQEYNKMKYKYINGPTATSFGDVWAIVS